ncbi:MULTISPECIES: dethiobiotin synthase [unclassified Vibrio]|uniref:ATP-dependent dethiobiotin synthetase BioD n=1 Tax=Vibrio sp. HB236076 TaxID=3232307 RepID=A0AB39HCY0_9VIBR|nr:dethiobiotin synthase [Vibrio sp. HB161653]MDP5253659.1 dethiobiotin synthase [Vibrio sp. HB161653]
MNNAFFVTGTNTEVGKTVASQALLQALAAQGWTTCGYKPVAAGCDKSEQGYLNDDALSLQRHSTCRLPYHEVNPYALEIPASPHISAHRAQEVIELQRLTQGLQTLSEKADWVLVEGAGGWHVPLNDSYCFSDWVAEVKLPVVLVVGVQLGCLNHALLTQQAILAQGLTLAGWIANRINPGSEYYQENLQYLERTMKAPKLGEIPYLSREKRADLSPYIDNLAPLVGRYMK